MHNKDWYYDYHTAENADRPHCIVELVDRRNPIDRWPVAVFYPPFMDGDLDIAEQLAIDTCVHLNKRLRN